MSSVDVCPTLKVMAEMMKFTEHPPAPVSHPLQLGRLSGLIKRMKRNDVPECEGQDVTTQLSFSLPKEPEGQTL